MVSLTKREKSQIKQLAAQHGARNVRVFGSFVRGENKPDSDLDIIVDVQGRTSSWFPAGLIVDLEQLLGRPVDVVTENGLNPLLKETVLQDVEPL